MRIEDFQSIYQENKKLFLNGRPEHNLTDKKWQEEFQLRRSYTIPTKARKMTGYYSTERKQNYNVEYKGVTNWQAYCSFINSVLSVIRSGNVDYCYFKYQIMDLLRFHPDTLRTRYIDGYWQVWLEGKDRNRMEVQHVIRISA